MKIEKSQVGEVLSMLFKEKQKVEMATLIGKESDTTKLREISVSLNESMPEMFNFSVGGSDAELMDSIMEFEKKYRP